MKLLSFEQNGRLGYGLVAGNGVVDLGARLPQASLQALIANDALGAAARFANTAPDYDLAALRYAIPIPFPEKILCIGVNYANRNAEYKDGTDQPKYPSLFMRTPRSFVGHRVPIIRPRESVQLDYEGEIAMIIGKPGRRIDRRRARDHVAGLTCLNEGTIRDWVRHGKFNVTQGKNFDRTGAIGPWMVTAEEFGPFDALRVSTRVNGELRQDDTTANLMFPFDYLIEYLSTFMTLQPGDIIATGTPIGAGARFDPPRWLRPGDTVAVEAAGIGVLSNDVEGEAT